MEETELTGQGSSKGYCKRPIMVGVCGKGYLGVSFSHGSMCAEVVKWGGFYGYFGEQGLPVRVQECLKGFHRGYIDYPSRQFVPKWDRRVQHLCRLNLLAWPRSPFEVGWGKVNSMGNFRRPEVILNMDV